MEQPYSSSSSSSSEVIFVKKDDQGHQGPKLVTSTFIPYNPNSDMNCLKISNDGLSCDKCSYRFFPSKTGECQAVPHSCSRYNRQTGECLSCYTGYYLFQGTCKQRDPLCSSTDPVTKLCNKCYNGYILYNDKCFYRGNLKTSINDSSEQLC